MKLYRITSEKYASKLVASGRANRWNKDKQYVIYTSSSRALAALELVAHRGAIMEGLVYNTVVIEAREIKNPIINVDQDSLPKKWQQLENYYVTQNIGAEWYDNQNSLILKVPSALVVEEFNYIVNTLHPDFSKIKIADIENFTWDKRLL